MCALHMSSENELYNIHAYVYGSFYQIELGAFTTLPVIMIRISWIKVHVICKLLPILPHA